MFRSWTLNFMPRLGLGLDCNVVPALHPSDYSVIDDPAECIIKPVSVMIWWLKLEKGRGIQFKFRAVNFIN